MIYKEHRVENEEQLKEFFQKPKALQRLLVNKPGCPSMTYTDIIVDDKYIIVERGNITPCRGLHSIFPHRTVTLKWGWSADSKRFRGQLNSGQRSFIKDILMHSGKYEFVEHVPSMCLSNTVLRGILYGKITNPKAAIDAYGKSLKVKRLNKHVFSLASKLNLSPIVIMSVINPDQLNTCHEALMSRLENEDYSFQQNFRDMVEQAYALEEHINPMWSSKRIDDVHTEWSQRLMLLEVGSKSQEPIWSDEIVNVFASHDLELINTEARCFEEGYVMSHCCYTNYWHRVQNKKYLLFRVHKLTRFVTLGMRLSVVDEGVEFTIEQAHGKRNARVFDYEMNDIKERLNQPDVVETLEWMAGIAVFETPKQKASKIEPFDWGPYEQGGLPW